MEVPATVSDAKCMQLEKKLQRSEASRQRLREGLVRPT